MIIADSYYSKKLSAERLKLCYSLATSRVRQYFSAEIDHICSRIRPKNRILELGCGYGRILKELSPMTELVFGIDSSIPSIRMAREYLSGMGNTEVAVMNAVETAFPDETFDLVCCPQNGISAFNVDKRALVKEAVRITAKGGRVLFSSYSEEFWDARLEWFRIQSAHGLLGKIDEKVTGNGIIICKDGFKATTVGSEEFLELAKDLGEKVEITIVDGSSVFCEIDV